MKKSSNKPSLFEKKGIFISKKGMENTSRLYEMWQPVKGYEGIYLISSWGNVRTVSRIIRGKHKGVRAIIGQDIKPIRTKSGYFHVYLAKDGHQKWEYVHKLVAQAFIDNPDNMPRVMHINGDNSDNHINNLKWTNCSEILTGRRYSRLTDEQRKQNKQAYYQKHRQKYIDRAKAYYYAHKEHCLKLSHQRYEDNKRNQTAVWA